MALWKISELSAYLNVHPKTLYRWAAQGKIPVVPLNGQIRFDKDAIDHWVESEKKRHEEEQRQKEEQRKNGGGCAGKLVLVTPTADTGSLKRESVSLPNSKRRS